jgi:hypothetical protein
MRISFQCIWANFNFLICVSFRLRSFVCHILWCWQEEKPCEEHALALRLIKITDWQSCGNFTRLLYWYVSFLSLHRKTKPLLWEMMFKWMALCPVQRFAVLTSPEEIKAEVNLLLRLVMSHNIQTYRRRGCKGPQLHSQTWALDGGQWWSPR